MFIDVNIIVLAISGICVCLIFFTTLWTGVSPTPTSLVVKKKMLSILPDKLSAKIELKIYELGSGWGGLANALAQKYPDHQVIGIEISPIPWLYSRLMLAIKPQSNLSFHLGNFFDFELSDAALLVCYLLPETMGKLSEKFRSELCAGSLVLSNTFALRGWYVSEETKASDIYNSSVFLYKVGEGQRNNENSIT